MIYDSVLKLRKENFSNSVFPVCGPDNPTNWHRENRYIKDFDYKYNEDGFRCDPFTTTSKFSVLFLGCSMTMGVGLPIEETWAYQLYQKIQDKKNIKFPFWSLAVGGSSIDLQALYLNLLQETIKPTYIFLVIPPIYRRHIVLDNKQIFYTPIKEQIFGSEQLTDQNLKMIDRAKELLGDPSYIEFEALKSIMLINAVCEKYKTKTLYSYWDEITGRHTTFLKSVNSLNNFIQLDSTLEKKDLARDGLHHGPISHLTFVNSIWSSIENNI
jgi:hypothetical protein